jgi:N,N-dimethylformamidase
VGILIGYVSDERYVALVDVAVVIENGAGMIATRSLANGAVVADVEPGPCRVTLAKDGFGAKRVEMAVTPGKQYQFRLLSDRLLGYAWPKWVTAGQEGEFRIHSTDAYKLSLWRYGWEKELVQDLGWFDDHGPASTKQITPDGDYTETGLHWNRVGFGAKWHHQRVIAPPRTGLYYFHVKNARGEFFSFPWIVQPERPSAPIAVLTSNLTWNAYNNFGGRSNYVNQGELLPAPTVYARSDLERYTKPGTWPFEVHGAPLSFDRPEPGNLVPEDARITDIIEGRLACFYAPGEWRLLGWLEREGFAHDLYSETELHFGRLPLDRYRVLILNNHNEYISKEMYSRIKNWVERGGRLLYLAGCGMYAEVEFLDEHTIRCRQEGREDLRGEPSARLLGLGYSHAGYRTGAPYRVIAGSHWVFEGTGLKAGDQFGQRSLNGRTPGGASGLELDKLSPHAPANLVHLAKGTNPDDSGADLVLYETPAGGAVFSAGSLNWPLALPVDEGVSRVTANVLRRFLV